MHRPPDTRCNGTNCTAGKAVPAALGLSTARWVEERLGGYVRLSVEERREAVKELTTAKEDGGEGLSTRQAAAVLGVSDATVVRDNQADVATNVAPAASFSPTGPEEEPAQNQADVATNVAPAASSLPEEPMATEEPAPESPEVPAPTRRQERRASGRWERPAPPRATVGA